MKIYFLKKLSIVSLTTILASCQSGSGSSTKKSNHHSVNITQKNSSEYIRLDFLKNEDGSSIKLTNGRYKSKGDEACTIVTMDLPISNIDQSYYGGIVRVYNGGSGYFLYLVLLHNGVSVAHKFLGDRVSPKKIYFSGNQLNADYYDRTPEQAMSEKPTLQKHAKIKIPE